MATRMVMQRRDGSELFVDDSGDYFAFEQTAPGVLVYYARNEEDIDAFLALLKAKGVNSLPDRQTLLTSSCSIRPGNVYCSGSCDSSNYRCVTKIEPGLPHYCACEHR